MSPRTTTPTPPAATGVIRLEWSFAPGLLPAIAPDATRLHAALPLDNDREATLSLGPDGPLVRASVRVIREDGLFHIDAHDERGPVLAVTLDADRLLYARCFLWARWNVPGGRTSVPRLVSGSTPGP